MLLSDIAANFRIWHEQTGRRDFAFDDCNLVLKGTMMPYYYSDITDITLSWNKKITITFADDLSVSVSFAGDLFFGDRECGKTLPDDVLGNMWNSVSAYRREGSVFSLEEIFQMRAHDDFPQQLAAYLECLPSDRETTEDLLKAYFKFGDQDLQILIKLMTDLFPFLTEEEQQKILKHHRKKYKIALF